MAVQGCRRAFLFCAIALLFGFRAAMAAAVFGGPCLSVRSLLALAGEAKVDDAGHRSQSLLAELIERDDIGGRFVDGLFRFGPLGRRFLARRGLAGLGGLNGSQ